jgi:hypothetical protein
MMLSLMWTLLLANNDVDDVDNVNDVNNVNIDDANDERKEKKSSIEKEKNHISTLVSIESSDS